MQTQSEDLAPVVLARFPASVAQERCWVMEQMHPGNKGLNLAIRWELIGPAPEALVEAAFQKVVDRHEILRTRFVEADGAILQEVVETARFRLTQFDLRNVPKADLEQRIREIAVEHAAERFDLAQSLLLRVAMVRTGPKNAELLIAVHNSIFDGASIGVMGTEFGTILAALIEGRTPDLPDLPLQYGDYALWQQDYAVSPAMAEEEAYWVRHLKDNDYFEFPGARPRRPGAPILGTLVRSLPPEFRTEIEAASRALSASVFVLGTSAFAAALGTATGKSEVSFAIQDSGRDDVDLEPLIGIFTNPLVMRLKTEPNATLAEVASGSRQTIEAALASRHLPFDRLVQKLNPPRDPLRIPLVSIMFNLQRVFLVERSYGPIEMVSVPSHSPGTMYDLNVNVIGRKTGWKLMIDYNLALYDTPQIEAFAELYIDALARLCQAPQTQLAALGSPWGAPVPTSVTASAGSSPLAASASAPSARSAAASPALSRAEAAEKTAEAAGAAGLDVSQDRTSKQDPTPKTAAGPDTNAAAAEANQTPTEHRSAPDPKGETASDALAPNAPADAPASGPSQISAEPGETAKAPDQGSDFDKLRQIWAQILGLPPSAVDGDFFDLGGYSVLALRMLARAGEMFGKRPSLYEFLADPTLRGAARLMEIDLPPAEAETEAPEQTQPAPASAAPRDLPKAPVSEIPSPATRPPVPEQIAPAKTASADPPDTADLRSGAKARLLESPAETPSSPAVNRADRTSSLPKKLAPDEARMIWSLIELRRAPAPAPVLVSVNQTFLYHAISRDISAKACIVNLSIPDHVALARQAQIGFDAAMEAAARLLIARYPGRETILCGLCVDGRLALRLAQALEHLGQPPRSVAMIDTWAPGATAELSAMTRRLDRWQVRRKRAAHYLREWASGRMRLRDLFGQYRLTSGLAGKSQSQTEMAALIDATVDQLVGQTKGYRFAPYQGDVLIFLTEAQTLLGRDGVLGWSKLLAADLNLYRVKGWHGDALSRSGFGRVAEVLSARLARLEAKTPTEAQRALSPPQATEDG